MTSFKKLFITSILLQYSLDLSPPLNQCIPILFNGSTLFFSKDNSFVSFQDHGKLNLH